jgi:threonine aldolase
MGYAASTTRTGRDGMIDLRSDTVTLPSPAMRRAMADAELGDDVFGEDPTVQALEERSPSCWAPKPGCSWRADDGQSRRHLGHVPRGGEIIGPADVHTFSSEGAGQRSSPAPPWDGPVGRRRTVDLTDLRAAVRDPNDVHEAITSLITREHARAVDGPAAPARYVESVAAFAARSASRCSSTGEAVQRRRGTRRPARDLSPGRGLGDVLPLQEPGLPGGSSVVGDAAFIWRARRARKMVGGGMRQAGVFAAAGLVALQDGPDGSIDRLADDHANARYLADALASMAGVRRIDPSRVRTNFVLFGVGDDDRWPDDVAGRERVLRTRAAFLAELHDRGVRMIEYPKGMIRAIPHYGIERADIETSMAASRAALAAIGLAPAVPA